MDYATECFKVILKCFFFNSIYAQTKVLIKKLKVYLYVFVYVKAFCRQSVSTSECSAPTEIVNEKSDVNIDEDKSNAIQEKKNFFLSILCIDSEKNHSFKLIF